MYFKDEMRIKKAIKIKPSILELMEACYFDNYKFASSFNFDDWLEELVIRMAIGLDLLEDKETIEELEQVDPISPLSEFAENQ